MNLPGLSYLRNGQVGNLPHGCRLAVLAGLLWAVGLTAPTSGAEVETTEQRYLAGLRERRLFVLAESYCERRLTDPQLSPRERGSLTLEWIRIVADGAANAPADRRAELWQRADQVASTFLAQYPDHPQSLLIKTQQALTFLAQGELIRLEAEVAVSAEESLGAARDTLRRAHKLLEELAAEITATIPARRQPNPPADAWTADELVGLLHHVQFYLARTAQNQALSYPAGSPDRIAALTRAAEQLASLQREIPVDDPLGRRVQLEAAICRRLLKDRELTADTWGALDADGVPPELRLAARAEHARWQLTENRPQQAVQVLAAGRELAGTTSAELDLAHLETYVALWQAAAETQQLPAAQKWQEQALKTVELIEQVHGPYWGRRAELLLVGGGTRSSGSGAEILRRTADNFFRKGQLDEALVSYDKAAEAARQANDRQAAFELAYKSALVEQHRDRHIEAARRFRKLALDDPRLPQAANAHLLAIANQSHVWRSDANSGSDYLALLEEHLATWPQSPTVDAVRLWLGGYREREQSWEAALQAYRSVRADSTYFHDAIRGADRCWRAWFPARRAAGDPVPALANEAAAWLEQTVFGSSRQPPDPWNETQRAACLVASRLRLTWTLERRAEVEQQLRWALEGMPPPEDSWAADAGALLVAALAGQPGQTGEAKELLGRTPMTGSDQWFTLTSQLADLLAAAAGDARSELGGLLIVALDRLATAPEKLTADRQRQASRFRATALAAAGDQAAAITCLTELARQWPRDGEVQAELGDMLLTSAEPADWRRAQDHWRIVAAQSQPRSKLWFQAKYSVALAQIQLGEKEAAAKLIRYLQATENLAGSGFDAQFAELLRRCELK